MYYALKSLPLQYLLKFAIDTVECDKKYRKYTV